MCNVSGKTCALVCVLFVATSSLIHSFCTLHGRLLSLNASQQPLRLSIRIVTFIACYWDTLLWAQDGLPSDNKTRRGLSSAGILVGFSQSLGACHATLIFSR